MEQRDTEKTNTNSNGQMVPEGALTSFNLKHNSMSVLVKKTEKISTAIYMVTDFVHESEPLRNKLRSLSISFISNTRKVGRHSVEPQYFVIEDVKSDIEEIVVLIQLAATVGLISDMNATIIRTELEKVRTEFGVLYGDSRAQITTQPGYANVLLSPSMFDVVMPTENFSSIPGKSADSYKGQKDNNNVLYKNDFNHRFNQSSVTKKLDMGIKIARRNDVLNVIKNNGTASIKDVKSVLKDINEKTIQRELLSLVKEGVLKKEGEKRWSVYRIAP